MTTIARYTKKFARYLRNTRAVSALEYAILVGVIAVAIAAALTTFSGNIEDAMNTIGDMMWEALQAQVSAPAAHKRRRCGHLRCLWELQE